MRAHPLVTTTAMNIVNYCSPTPEGRNSKVLLQAARLHIHHWYQRIESNPQLHPYQWMHQSPCWAEIPSTHPTVTQRSQGSVAQTAYCQAWNQQVAQQDRRNHIQQKVGKWIVLNYTIKKEMKNVFVIYFGQCHDEMKATLAMDSTFDNVNKEKPHQTEQDSPESYLQSHHKQGANCHHVEGQAWLHETVTAERADS